MKLFYRGRGGNPREGRNRGRSEEEVKMKEKEVKPERGNVYVDFEQRGKTFS